MEHHIRASLQQKVPRNTFIGLDLRNIDPPAVVLDAAVVRRNCQCMLETAKALGLGFRAHIKTHKVCVMLKCPCELEWLGKATT